ncbi:MAG: hypothetical protein AAF293_04325 [Pseudomonadota bacterium]
MPPRVNTARDRQEKLIGTDEFARSGRDMYRDQSALLDIVATDPGTNTVGAFESQHGVPVVGAQ